MGGIQSVNLKSHSVTGSGVVEWDGSRRIGWWQGEDWEEGFASGLLRSLCFFPLLSYGSTAPLAALPPDSQKLITTTHLGWLDGPTLAAQRYQVTRGSLAPLP